MRRTTALLAVSILAGTFGACLFDPEDAEGLACFLEEDCGPDLDCVQGFCAKPGSGDEGGTGGPGDGGPADSVADSSPPADSADDGDGDGDGGGDGGPVSTSGPAPEGCSYTNDGECDEPEGTNLCPEGTDVADCAGSGGTSGGGSCGVAGDSCVSTACCEPAVCVNFENVGTYCSDPCVYGTDCMSGCCGITDSGNGVCAPTNFCA